MDRLLNWHSSLYRLKKAISWWTRFRDFLRNKKKVQTGPLTTTELQEAEMTAINYTQRIRLPDVTKTVEENGSTTSKNCKTNLPPALLKLAIGKFASTLRVIGRLSNAPVPQDIKNPILLPPSHICDLIIRDCHIKNMHSSVNHTWAQLRERFWMINATPAIKRIIFACVTCRKVLAQPCNQIMSDLPAERVTPGQRPFKNIGLDCFGPFSIEQSRSKVKRWGLIITCMSSRVVHLEMLYSLDTSSFLNALRRFIARRGKPNLINCDNGSNFKAAEKILKQTTELRNSSEMNQYYRQENIRFQYNPPQASHFGGHFERLIRLVKRIF